MAFSSLSRFPLLRTCRSFTASQLRRCVNLRIFWASPFLIRVRRYLFTHYTPETLLNYVFEDLRTPKVPNTMLLWIRFPQWFLITHITAFNGINHVGSFVSNQLFFIVKINVSNSLSRLVRRVASQKSCLILHISKILHQLRVIPLVGAQGYAQ
jgi:hypothetical protein